MFFPGSRYQNMATDTIDRPDGTRITVVQLPLPSTAPIQGYHRRLAGQRLDLIGSFYLQDPTTFWRLCDANNAVAPDALAARELVGIPVRGGQ